MLATFLVWGIKYIRYRTNKILNYIKYIMTFSLIFQFQQQSNSSSLQKKWQFVLIGKQKVLLFFFFGSSHFLNILNIIKLYYSMNNNELYMKGKCIQNSIANAYTVFSIYISRFFKIAFFFHTKVK